MARSLQNQEIFTKVKYHFGKMDIKFLKKLDIMFNVLAKSISNIHIKNFIKVKSKENVKRKSRKRKPVVSSKRNKRGRTPTYRRIAKRFNSRNGGSI